MPLGKILMAASLLLVAANLRTLFTSLAVLLPEISEALALSPAVSGYLTTLPVLCMGLFAPFAPFIAQKIGIERSLLLVLLAITFGTAARSFLGYDWLFLGTALAGAGIAIGNVLLPSLVKRDFSRQAAIITGLYTMFLVGGAALASAITIPISKAFGGSWQVGLGIWTILGLVALLAWTPVAFLAGKGKAGGRQKLLRVKGLYQDPLAWAITIFMGMQSALAYSMMGWLPHILRSQGLEATQAGLITSVSIVMQVIASLVTPYLAIRNPSQSLLAVFLALVSALSLMVLIIGPHWLIWPLAISQGLAQGAMLSLSLMLIVIRSGDANIAAHLSSMVQTMGYIMAALGPLLIGYLYDGSGQFNGIALMIGTLGVLSALSGWYAGRNSQVKAQVIK